MLPLHTHRSQIPRSLRLLYTSQGAILGAFIATIITVTIYQSVILPRHTVTPAAGAAPCASTPGDASCEEAVAGVSFRPGGQSSTAPPGVPPCASTSGDVSLEGVVAGVSVRSGVLSNAEVAETPTLPQTVQEQIIQQDKMLRALPCCEPRPGQVRLQEELHRSDFLLDKTLLTSVGAVDRCPYTDGLCYGESRCRPTNVTHVLIPLLYIDEGLIKYAERAFRKDLACSCQ